MNLFYIFTKHGIPKAATLILGVVSVSLIGHAYDRSYYNNVYKLWLEEGESIPSVYKGLQKEVFFLSVSIICLLFSLAFLLCHLMTEEMENIREIKFMDAGFHALAALLLIIGGILAIVSANDIHKTEKATGDKGGTRFQYKSEKTAAGVFGVLNGFFYGVTAIFIIFFPNKS